MNHNPSTTGADASRPGFFGRVRSLDFLLLALLMLFSASLAWPYLGNRGGSSEDGAMLLRYSQNVADGHGIVWNVGHPPVEGATDFFYMLAVAFVAKLTHHDAWIACRELLFCSWIALTGVIFAATRWTLRAPALLAFALAPAAANSPPISVNIRIGATPWPSPKLASSLTSLVGTRSTFSG